MASKSTLGMLLDRWPLSDKSAAEQIQHASDTTSKGMEPKELAAYMQDFFLRNPSGFYESEKQWV